MTSLHDELEKKLHDSNATPMSLPLQFLKAITCDFSTEYELGRGGYGVVYKGVLQSGKIIAVKKLFEIHLVDDKTFQKEVSYLMDIKHQHVVQFIGYCAESSWETIKQPSGKFIWAEIPRRLLCFEYLCNRSLETYISVPTYESSVLEWSMRYEIIRGICNGLNFLHEECRMVHLDLKPENILMDATMTPKIADFGLSRIFGNQQSRIVTNNSVGSRGYMAPEYLIRGIISMKADIFSLGVIMIEIITGCSDYPYFQLDSPHSTATSCQHFIDNVLGSWRNNFESTSKYISTGKYNLQVKECITIALKCVDPAMEKRPTAKDIIQVLDVVDQMDSKKEMPSEMQLLVLDTTVSKKHMSRITENISNIETDSKLEKMKKSPECLSPTPLWKSSTGSEGHQEEAKESGEPRQIDKTSECTDKLLILNTTASMDIAPQSVTGEMFMNKTDGKVAGETKMDVSLSPMLTLSESSAGYQNYQGESSTSNQNYQDGAQAFSEPQSAPDTTIETLVIPGSSALLHVHPLELHFRFEPNKSMACSLDLTNNTDEKVAFGLLKKSDEQACFLSSLPMFGIVHPGTTYTLVVIMNKHKDLPKQRKVDLILQSTTYYGILSDVERCKQHFWKAEELGNIVHKVTLTGVCALRGEKIFEPIPPSIKIISVKDNGGSYISNMDVNQTEQLIITCNSSSVDIWNSDTQKSMGSVYIAKEASVMSVKVIARMGWFLAVTNDGFIHVCNYKNETQNITRIRAHGSYFRPPQGSDSTYLTIHPTQSYVLSACATKIKLLDWDNRWKCLQTFEEHTRDVCALAFNPEDYKSFASASINGTIKVWSLDSPESKYTLSGHLVLVSSMDFFTRDGQQYLITGSDDNTAKIWDMRKMECVHTLPHSSGVRFVLPHPKLPLLVTGTADGHVYLWSFTNFRLKRRLKVGDLSDVRSLACLNESGRIVVAHGCGLSVIEISEEEEEQGGGSSSNNKSSISATY